MLDYSDKFDFRAELLLEYTAGVVYTFPEGTQGISKASEMSMILNPGALASRFSKMNNLPTGKMSLYRCLLAIVDEDKVEKTLQMSLKIACTVHRLSLKVLGKYTWMKR